MVQYNLIKKTKDMDENLLLNRRKAIKFLDEFVERCKSESSLKKEDYAYLGCEQEIDIFSHNSDEDVNVRAKNIVRDLWCDIKYHKSEFQRFIIIFEFNAQNEMRMSEIEPTKDLYRRFFLKKSVIWGLSDNNNVNGLRITIIASK